MLSIDTLKEEIIKNNITAYIVPTADEHLSEYIPDYYKAREYLTKFTGSAGTLVVTKDSCRLWTDGRYFIQAEHELSGSNISLMRIGEKNVPTIHEYLGTVLTDGGLLGFDARLISTKEYINYSKVFEIKHIDLLEKLWTDRAPLPDSMIYEFSEYYAGESRESKISRVREALKVSKTDTLILSSLEDQAWLYNLRGYDIARTPVFLAYTVICDDECHLFVEKTKLNENVKNLLDEADIILHSYNEIYNFVSNLQNKIISFDEQRNNALLYICAKDNNSIKFQTNPTLFMKAIKNPTEIKNTETAHEYDGIAVTKFMYWLKTNVNQTHLTELDCVDKILSLRKESKHFLDQSFDTICAYGSNAAMMHYHPSRTNNQLIKPEGMLLLDSGGHYLLGSTDITRTFACGNPTKEEKKYFTTVLKSMINLSDTIFLKGCTGQNLDIKARGPIWKLMLDYKCGTGHGVGHVLAVHEGPNGFRWKALQDKHENSPILPGMITTNEPGIYIENQFGIRIENELLCKELMTNTYGTFLGFETLTYAPIDLDLVDEKLLSDDEKKWLNDYHQLVYEKISYELNDQEREWLSKYTREI